jgi:ech hydrogenase subunit A
MTGWSWLGRINPGALAGLLVLSPAFLGLFVYFVRTKWSRKGIVTATGWVLSLSALALFGLGTVRRETIAFSPQPVFDLPWDTVIMGADALLMLALVIIGFAIRKPLVVLLTLLQAAAIATVELAGPHGTIGASSGSASGNHPAMYIDWLTIIMVMIVSVIGSIVAVYGLPYMKEHEKHAGIPESSSKRPRFFLTILVFLGAMNGLVLSDNLLWLFFFWEVTTLCSYLLIRHDGTPEALANAYRALWINMLGGVAFAGGLLILARNVGTVSIQGIVQAQAAGPGDSATMLGLALLCVAGFTKAAQMPFHSWLLGAMVAPTPVSALLHSSTMVKAGVYLIARLAPAFYSTGMSEVIAVAGGFTFAAAAFLAIGQTNAKKVLAYSTISNLGLIIACAGLNTPLSMAAAVMLLIFHAISKALLFMAAGVVEHGIWSRDIEDMQGLVSRMPLTTLTMVIGILSMLLPPFGVLIAKLAAIEASAHMPATLLLLVMGSTLTVVFWTKWTGRLLAADPSVVFPRIEHLHSMYFVPLLMLTLGAVGFSLMVVPLLTQLIVPAVEQYYRVIPGVPTSMMFDNVLGVPWALVFGVLALGVLIPLMYFRKQRTGLGSVYLCGEQVTDAPATTFRTVAETMAPVMVRGYYFERVVGEDIHTRWMTVVGALALALMLGAAFLPR